MPISLAIVGDHAIFLDVARDRYFTLPPIDNDRLLADACRIGGERRIPDWLPATLTTFGLRDHVAYPDPISPVTASWPDVHATSPRPRAPLVASALGHRTAARARLRFAGLQRALYAVRTSSAQPRQAASLDLLIAAHRQLEGHLTFTDACLPRSIALVSHARRHAHDVRLVIGIKIDPFGAHAWAQLGELVLADSIDQIIPFTPIFVAP